MELPSFYDSAARIVQAGLNKKLPRGWENICVIGAAALEDVEGKGEKEEQAWPGLCVVENKKAYVLVNVDVNGDTFDMASAVTAIKLLTHEVRGHIDKLRELGGKGIASSRECEEEDEEEKDHLRMVRLLDGTEGANSYVSAIRKVLPFVSVQNFPGIRQKILEVSPVPPHLPPDVLDYMLDDRFKQAYLNMCIDDIEEQVLEYFTRKEYRESDEPDPQAIERLDKVVEPLREIAFEPNNPYWRPPLHGG